MAIRLNGAAQLILPLVLTAWIFAGVSQESHAGGLYINEFATPSMGTAGAGAEAWANDASTGFALHNPAGMTRLEGNQVSLGFGIGKADAEFDADPGTPFGPGNGGNAGSLIPLLGSHGVLSLTEDLKVGMSVFSLAGASLDYSNNWTGRYQNQEITLLTVSANPTIAYQPTDWFSIAAGPIITYADLDMKLAVPPGGASQAEIDGDDIAFGFNAGLLFELSPRTRIGVIYVSEQEIDFDGDLEIDPVGPDIGSTTELDFAQLVRIGAYHELNDEWALLGTVGWEDWSTLSDLLVSTDGGTAAIPRDWRDTYHFSIGAHWQPEEDWLFQAGFTYDTSPVSDGDRTADMPIDRQLRFALGTQHELSEGVTIGGAIEYVDLGDAKIDNSTTLIGDYENNRILFFAINANIKF